MSLIKISELPNGETLELLGDEIAVIVKDGVTYKIPLSTLLKLDVITRMGNLSQEDITTSAQGGFRVVPKLNGVADYFGMVAAEDIDFPIDSNTYLLLSRIFGDGEGYVLSTAKIIPSRILNGYPGKNLEFELPNEGCVFGSRPTVHQNIIATTGSLELEPKDFTTYFIDAGTTGILNIEVDISKMLFGQIARFVKLDSVYPVSVEGPGMSPITLKSENDFVDIQVIDNAENVRVIGKSIASSSKFYEALLTQVGTDAPTATVDKNDFTDVIIDRAAEGNYSLYSPNGEFVEGKTYVTIGHAQITGSFTKATWESINRIRIETYLIAIDGTSIVYIPIEDEPLYKITFIVEVKN